MVAEVSRATLDVEMGRRIRLRLRANHSSKPKLTVTPAAKEKHSPAIRGITHTNQPGFDT